jgi:hypothetical protein
MHCSNGAEIVEKPLPAETLFRSDVHVDEPSDPTAARVGRM